MTERTGKRTPSFSARLLLLTLVGIGGAACDGAVREAACDGCVDANACQEACADAAVDLDGSVREPDAKVMADDGSLLGDAASDAARATGDAAGPMAWPSGPIRPTRLRVPDPAFSEAPCAAAGEGTIASSEVLVGQTHLTPKGWPFQTISANRPLTVALSVAGTGAAPAFSATARLHGKALSICLTGPAMLPASRDDLVQSYRGSLPAAWVLPGLTLEVSVGDKTETLTLDVKPENGLTLYLVSAELFGDGSNDTSQYEAQLLELLARLPVSYLDVGINPFGPFRPRKLLIGPRDDGSSPTGEAAPHGALVVDENPHCSDADRAASRCAPHSGYGTMAGVLETLDTFREANGVAQSSTWYADLARALGGGLAGGQRGAGDDTGLVMNHELGHAWGFPHWAASHTDYPYEGVRSARGGFGDRWSINQLDGLPQGPLCEGSERQSPMQRSGATCLPKGARYDPYSDYEAARLLRMTLGASTELSGTVAYRGGVLDAATRPYRLPKESGRPRMVWSQTGPGMTLELFAEASNSFVPHTPSHWNRIAQSEVPVIMFAGGLVLDGEWFVEDPIPYVGNLLRPIDPTVAEDYAYLYANRASEFYWAHDLILRFTLDDGSTFARLQSGELREAGHLVRFAINLPAELGRRVTKLEILSRPLGQFAQSSRLTVSDSAASYLASARVLATWQRP